MTIAANLDAQDIESYGSRHLGPSSPSLCFSCEQQFGIPPYFARTLSMCAKWQVIQSRVTTSRVKPSSPAVVSKMLDLRLTFTMTVSMCAK